MRITSWIGQLRENKTSLNPVKPDQSLERLQRELKKDPSRGKELVACSFCNCLVRSDRLEKHVANTHTNTTHRNQRGSQNGTNSPQGRIIVCPQCGVRIKENRLRKHVRKKHKIGIIENRSTREHIKPKKKVRRPLPKQIMTPEIAKTLRTEMNETEIITNKEIAAYLKRNPHKEELGKFGLPQDKHRWGFYGSKSMQYDIWRKGDKEK